MIIDHGDTGIHPRINGPFLNMQDVEWPPLLAFLGAWDAVDPLGVLGGTAHPDKSKLARLRRITLAIRDQDPLGRDWPRCARALVGAAVGLVRAGRRHPQVFQQDTANDLYIGLLEEQARSFDRAVHWKWEGPSEEQVLTGGLHEFGHQHIQTLLNAAGPRWCIRSIEGYLTWGSFTPKLIAPCMTAAPRAPCQFGSVVALGAAVMHGAISFGVKEPHVR